MRYRNTIWLVILLLLPAACSNTRFLAEDQLLYTGQKKTQVSGIPEDINSAVTKELRKEGSDQKPNNSIFNRRVLPPVGLWVYNYWEHDEQKKVGNWLYNTLSAPPVLISDINPELRAQKMENDLFDKGFFQARAWSRVDTSDRNPKKAMVEYFVEVGPSFHYNDIRIDSMMESLDTMVNMGDFTARIRKGAQFDVKELADARSGITRQYQNLGYYYFNQDFIELEADTSLEGNELNLLVSPREDLPGEVLMKYRIDSISVYLSRSSDSLTNFDKVDMPGDIQFYTGGNDLKPEVIQDVPIP